VNTTVESSKQAVIWDSFRYCTIKNLQNFWHFYHRKQPGLRQDARHTLCCCRKAS